MTPGEVLIAKRGERGLTIEQVAAATRIRIDNLRALEADDFDEFPAAVYARGYLRTYATFLGLDADALLRRVPDAGRPNLAIGLDDKPRPARFVLTTPAVAAAGLVLLAGAFAGYAWRQITADQQQLVAVVSPSPRPTPSGAPATPTASPAVQARPIVVGVRVTDSVWINAVVDGNPQYGDSGRTLPAGSVVYFTGVNIKLTSGKASATFISIDGRNLGPMGVGVTTREFSSQTSP